MHVNGLIVAAGEGKRTGKKTPKAFLSLAGRPMILHTLGRFATCENVRKVILVTLDSEVFRCQELIRSDARLRSLECVVKPGGPRRQDSVEQGLACLDADCEVVVIHDGARPFVSSRLIDRCVEIAFEKGAVVVGVPVRDTIKVVTADSRVRETPPRKSLWEIQTPQVFRVELIREAYLRAAQEDLEVTDDAMLVERLGASVAVLQGEKTNIKMTFEEDFLFGEALLSKGRISD
ncbi:MAG: 2-C-methyl-D-erythritol 4-phosphate cytidylyltransferase [Candidatus Binatia bacterium]